MKSAQIILLSVFAACAYGIIHDQITVRLCLEYFTVAHPPLFHTSSPTVLALCWGVAATAGIGAVFGLVLALVAQSPGTVSYSLSRLAQYIVRLLAVMAAAAFAAGVVGYQLSRSGFISLPARLTAIIPASHHDRFMAVWFAHGASYLVGLVGGSLLCFWIWRARGKPSAISLLPRTHAGIVRAGFIGAVIAYILWARFYAS